MSNHETPRHQFKGVIEVHAVTGRRKLVHKSGAVYAGKRFAAQLCCIGAMLFTVLTALLVMLSRYHKDDAMKEPGEHGAAT